MTRGSRVRWLSAALGAALLALTGCAETALTVASSQMRIIEGVTPAEVFDHAVVVLQREFGRVAPDRAEWRITSAPVEYRSARDSGDARGLVGASSTLRRTAVFSVQPREGAAAARLRIDLERRDTSRRGVASRSPYETDDRPGYSAIDRDAALTEQQNEVWTNIGRDRALERALLDELQSEFAAATTQPAVSSAMPTESPAAKQ